MKKNRDQGQPFCHEGHRRPVTRRDFLAQGLIAGSGIVLSPSLFGLLRKSDAALRADHAVRADRRLGPDPVPLLRPRGRRQRRGLQRDGGRPGRPARLPAGGRLREAGPARHHAAVAPGAAEQRARPRLPCRQRLPARDPLQDVGRDARERERHRDLRALRERHGRTTPTIPCMASPRPARAATW